MNAGRSAAPLAVKVADRHRVRADGARLLLVDIDPVTAADSADEVARTGGTATAVTEDVADESACRRVVEAALDAFEPARRSQPTAAGPCGESQDTSASTLARTAGLARKGE